MPDPNSRRTAPPPPQPSTEVFTALSRTTGRVPISRVVVELAVLAPSDRAIDFGLWTVGAVAFNATPASLVSDTGTHLIVVRGSHQRSVLEHRSGWHGDHSGPLGIDLTDRPV